MSDRISRTQAITRVMLATKLTRADAEEWLDDAFPIEPPQLTRDPAGIRDPLRFYAGGLTYVDIEAGQDSDVDLESLEEALADLLGTRTAQPRKAGKDRSFEKDDKPLVEQMRSHVQGGLTPSAAALLFVDEAVGGGSAESKQRRLQRLYSKIYGET
ncbi:hypothetical protein MPL3365_30197 [Mesorhizobium plurifarium]|uniref:Uncharacterized protein n=1 Tax=Mesorhizobium plurifarium TaxID=69974 RepID=A0A090GV24_MESPL|nr:hypothetical protein MPL3365_30197 [Mesorhizobium plurifarium]